MYPELIPGLPIQTFGAMIAAGILISWKVVEKLWKGRDLSTLVFILVIAGIAGGRIAHVVEYWSEDGFGDDFASVFAVWKGGLVFYGGLAAAVLAFAAWCVAKKPDVLALLDVLAVGVPLGHAFGRIGCFCYGCCWGRLSDSIFAVAFPSGSPVWCSQVRDGLIARTAAHSLPVLPTQLFESAFLFALFALLLWLYRRKRAFTAAAYLVGYGLWRFAIEFLRDDARPSALGLSSAQLFSIPLVVAGLVVLIWSIREHGRRSSYN